MSTPLPPPAHLDARSSDQVVWGIDRRILLFAMLICIPIYQVGEAHRAAVLLLFAFWSYGRWSLARDPNHSLLRAFVNPTKYHLLDRLTRNPK